MSAFRDNHTNLKQTTINTNKNEQMYITVNIELGTSGLCIVVEVLSGKFGGQKL